MDLVFRIPQINAEHPWRYYVLDWKSDVLKNYDRDSLETCMEQRHYNLQARIYSHALDKYLKGIVGEAYIPQQNLGGAVYLFLRGFNEITLETPCLFRGASPEEDAAYTKDLITKMAGSSVL
ncbi:Exodeoxyribonuclease V beta chain [Chitinispirillum alkaliphilum]|nr:Exodeoxyribonuclease V beta chain [Chitinispirillum alkaliphilum]